MQIISAETFKIDSKYAILYQLNDNEVLYSLKETEKISIASLTKIMTCLVAIENEPDLNKKITITNEVFKGTSGLALAGFKVSDVVTYYDLLYGAMLPSGADATNALAISISGSIPKYVELMNKKAEELGLKNTHFVNTTGLDAKGHYSTVSDVAKLLMYALKNDEFKKIYTTMTYKTSNNKLTFKSTVLKNSKKYNLNTSIIKGAKTGFTDDAGLCMASISSLNSVDYLLVTCGANTKDDTPHQILDALTIYNYYDYNYKYQTILKKNQKLVTLKVKNSYTKEITFESLKEIKKYLNKNIDISLITYKYNGIQVLSPKNKINSKIGAVSIYYEDDLLDSVDIILKEEIESNIGDKIITILGITLATILLILLILDLFKNIKRKLKRLNMK